MLTCCCLWDTLWTDGFTDHGAPLDVLEGIEQFMKKEGIKDIAELIGSARR